jgi:hypothetical protein
MNSTSSMNRIEFVIYWNNIYRINLRQVQGRIQGGGAPLPLKLEKNVIFFA